MTRNTDQHPTQMTDDVPDGDPAQRGRSLPRTCCRNSYRPGDIHRCIL